MSAASSRATGARDEMRETQVTRVQYDIGLLPNRSSRAASGTVGPPLHLRNLCLSLVERYVHVERLNLV